MAAGIMKSNPYAARLARRITVTKGQARKVNARILYVSPDHRAVLMEIDTCTKYSQVDCYVDDHSVGIRLGAGERTLRRDRRFKRPTEVVFQLPRVKGRWLVNTDATRYGCTVSAICLPDDQRGYSAPET